MTRANRRVLPGFSLSLGYTLFYLSVLVVLPILACFSKAGSLTAAQFKADWTATHDHLTKLPNRYAFERKKLTRSTPKKRMDSRS